MNLSNGLQMDQPSTHTHYHIVVLMGIRLSNVALGRSVEVREHFVARRPQNVSLVSTCSRCPEHLHHQDSPRVLELSIKRHHPPKRRKVAVIPLPSRFRQLHTGVGVSVCSGMASIIIPISWKQRYLDLS